MNLFDLVMDNKNSTMVSQVAKQFGLNDDQARGAIGELLPSLQRGMQHNTSGEKGLEELLAAVEKGSHQRYVDQPDVIGLPETTEDGNNILGHIFGNKEVSRNVASNAAKQTGLSSGLLKKMLPVIASIAMGTLSKQIFSKGGIGGGSSGRAMANKQSRGIVASILDSDNDGSMIDDILGMAFKMIR